MKYTFKEMLDDAKRAGLTSDKHNAQCGKHERASVPCEGRTSGTVLEIYA